MVINFICKKCNKEFSDYNYKNRKYCSYQCYWSDIFGKIPKNYQLNNYRKVNGVWNKNKKMSKKFRKICSQSHKGQIPWNKGLTNIYTEKTIQKIRLASQNHKHSNKTKEKMRQIAFQNGFGKWMSGKKLSKETKIKIGLKHRGNKHWNWKGGKSYEPYASNFNIQLKEKVRVRDNFKCQICGIPELECKSRLQIHHIDYNKLNSNIENLISLCNSCHTKTNHNREYWTNYFIRTGLRLEF